MASGAVSGTKPGKGGSVTHNEGDWICSDKGCANINFSWRTNCNKCGKEKGKVDVIKKTGSEIGTQAATRSGGLFSADDWQCSVCSNVNWARRSECNVCRTPKFNISEARTGAGGGYNEREDVQYKEREESSDDEYDEFGRKKKKFRRKTNGSKQISTTITYELEKTKSDEMDLSKFPLAPPSAGPEKKKEEAEEEEEEDGDDEDVSKYDLMAELDDEAPPTTSVTKGGSNLPSRKSCSPSPRRSRSPRPRHMSSRSQSSRSRSRSPVGVSRSREGGRRRRSRSPSPRQRRRSSRSRSRSRTRKRSRSHSRTRSPHRRRSGGSKDSGRRSSRSRSRSRDRKRRSYSRSQSRSRSRDRKRSYRSRSRSRDRDGYR